MLRVPFLWLAHAMFGRVRRAWDEWQLRRTMSRLPPMQVTPELRLLGAYMQVRNALIAGTDPAEIEAERDESGQESVSALGYFRAGLRITFNTTDELAAFDEFARTLVNEARALRHSSEALASQGNELQLVRDRLVQHST